MSKKNKFNCQWSNQTELGKKFGLSAIAVGKVLIENGLKDQKTKHATEMALSDGYAKSTPLKDGTPYFMWNVHKVKQLISADTPELSKIDYWITEATKTMKEADRLCDEGNDKMGYMLADVAFDDVPKEIREEVKAKVQSVFANQK